MGPMAMEVAARASLVQVLPVLSPSPAIINITAIAIKGRIPGRRRPRRARAVAMTMKGMGTAMASTTPSAARTITEHSAATRAIINILLITIDSAAMTMIVFANMGFIIATIKGDGEQAAEGKEELSTRRASSSGSPPPAGNSCKRWREEAAKLMKHIDMIVRTITDAARRRNNFGFINIDLTPRRTPPRHQSLDATWRMTDHEDLLKRICTKVVVKATRTQTEAPLAHVPN